MVIKSIIVIGKYPRIPTEYSQELSTMIRQLLHVAPHLRPACEDILKMPSVIAKIVQLFPNEDFSESERNTLLSTIRIPKNIMYLSDKLPRASYEIMEKDNENLRNTTKEDVYHLPTIPDPKRPKQKKQLKGEMSPLQEKLAKIQKYKIRKNGVQLEVINEDRQGGGTIESEVVKKQERNKIEKPQYYNDMIEQDTYINQLLNKKNPIIKTKNNSNIKKISEIYSNNKIEYNPSVNKRKIEKLLKINKMKNYIRRQEQEIHLAPYLHPNTKALRQKIGLGLQGLQILSPLKQLKVLPKIN